MFVCFGSVYWECQDSKILNYLSHWKNRCLKYLNPEFLFMTTGSQVDKSINPIDCELIQLGIEKNKPHSDNWNYWKISFMTGLFYSLSQYQADIIIHCQTTTFLNYDFKEIIEEFKNSEYSICAPRISSHWGHAIESGFIMLKKDAAIKYLTQPLRPAFSNNNVMCVEKELLELFGNEWLNPFPQFSTFRKTVEKEDTRTSNDYDNISKCYNINDNVFYKLPLIIGPKHCTFEELDKWLEINKE